MAVRTWEPIKVRFCQHAGREVNLEAEVVYPAEYLPDTPPRVLAHRCSHAYLCSLSDRPSCVWSGTNPSFDPFTERL
jgi:hypothetical protein